MILAAAGLAAVYLVFYCAKGESWPKSAIKTLSILLLAVVAWRAMAPPLLVGALVLCAIGDFLLSRGGERGFLLGVGAFALGHVAYIVLIFGLEASQPARLVQMPVLLAVIGFAVFAAIMARVLLPRAGEMAGPVLAYIPIICGMGIAALSLPTGGWLLPGALLFVLSDFVLALEMFVLAPMARARKFTPYVVWATYWSAQFMLFAALS